MSTLRLKGLSFSPRSDAMLKKLGIERSGDTITLPPGLSPQRLLAAVDAEIAALPSKGGRYFDARGSKSFTASPSHVSNAQSKSEVSVSEWLAISKAINEAFDEAGLPDLDSMTPMQRQFRRR